MATRFGTLRHNDIGTGVDCRLGMRLGLDLTDQLGAGGFDLAGKQSRIGERDHQRGGRMGQRLFQQFGMLCQRPGDEAATDPRIARRGKFTVEPRGIAIAAAKNAKSTGGGNGSRQFAASNEAHRCAQDRMGDAKPIGQPCAQHLDGKRDKVALIGAPDFFQQPIGRRPANHRRGKFIVFISKFGVR
jgi:hypothetical protein